MPNIEVEPDPAEPKEAGAAVTVQKPEKKIRRKQIVLQPSVHDKAKEKCIELDISMNEVISQLLRQWINME